MKLDIRWQALLAVICLSLILSLLSFQVQTAGQCTTRVPATGGAVIEGVVGLPQRLNPLLADNNPVDQAISSLVFDGLTGYDESGQLVPVLARSWAFGDDGRTVSFTLREGLTWHDGRPVTTADVAFSYGLLQNEAFPAPESLRMLWQTVTISPTSALDISFILPQPYTPFLDATIRGILPAHLLADVPVERLAEHPFNRSPVGTGPFLVVPGSDWRRDGRLQLAANPAYWREGVQIDTLEYRFYADSDSLAQAFAAGEIQSILSISPAALPQLAALPGMRLFTSPAPQYSQLLFNLKESAGSVARTLAVRQALAHALDREALVDRTLNGQGLPFEGPYLPTSWAYYPGLLTTYGPDPAAAATLLSGAGWSQREGRPTWEKEGQSLGVRLLATDTADMRAVAADIAGQWTGLGIETELVLVEPAGLPARLAEGEFDVALVTVSPPGDPDLYDFWSQEAIVSGQNYGGWNNRRASEALEAARQLPTGDERRPYYEAFLRFFDADLPALTLFQHLYTYGLSETVNRADIGRIASPRDRFENLADWFLLYREVAVPCPEASPPGP